MKQNPKRPHPIEIADHGGAEAGNVGPDVEGPKRLLRNQIGIVRRKLQSDVEGFFDVGRLAGIELLAAQLDKSPIAARTAKCQFFLELRRPLEEFSRGIEHALQGV